MTTRRDTIGVALAAVLLGGPAVAQTASVAPLPSTVLQRGDARAWKIDIRGRKLTSHSFRHTYATLMAEAVGSNPFVLKQLLGHAQLSTTDRYCHVAPVAQVIDISDLMGALPGCPNENEPVETGS